MSRDGFTTADIGVATLRDSKFKRLGREFPDLILRAVVAYIGIVLACWECGDRLTAEDGWPDIVPFDGDVLAALRAVGLLDRGNRVPVSVWHAWYGPAFTRRQERRQSGSLGGQRKAANRRLAELQHSSSVATAELQHSSSDALPDPSYPSYPRDSPSESLNPSTASTSGEHSSRGKRRTTSTNGKGDGLTQVGDTAAVAALSERVAAWNAAHPGQVLEIPIPRPDDDGDWLGGTT